jgi:hypothetical protein
MEISQNDWYASFLLPSLKVSIDECLAAGKNPIYRDDVEGNIKKLNYHINDLSSITGIKPGNWINNLNYLDIDEAVAVEVRQYLDSLRFTFRNISRSISYSRDTLFNQITGKVGGDGFVKMRERDYNESLADFVLNRLAPNKIYDAGNKYIQKADPVFMCPGSKIGRAHFFAPYKQIGELKIETLLFNLIAIWIMNIFLFVTLYFNVLRRSIRFLESLKLPILRKYGRELLQF